MSKRAYTEETLQAAIAEVKARRLSITAAAREFAVPRKTLHDRVNGISSAGFGPDRMLTDKEETALVNYALYRASIGFPLTREMMRAYIRQVVREPHAPTLFNMENGPSDSWFRKFFARHPELSEKKAEKQERSRSRMSHQATIDQFFELLNKTLKEKGINDAKRIFNCDETGWTGREMSRKAVIGPKGKHVYQQQVTASTHTTALLCVSAAGHFLPPMIIFQNALPHRAYKDGIPDDWHFSSSPSGFIDSEIFEKWFEKCFLAHCGRARPVVLLMDNHESHVSLSVVEKARENDVILLGLPPHTTHILQPLDVGIIGPLKQRFSTLATTLCSVNTNVVIGKDKFPAVLNHALDQMTPATIKEAFRKSGIFPTDASVIDRSQLIPSLFPTSSVAPGTSAAATSTAATTSPVAATPPTAAGPAANTRRAATARLGANTPPTAAAITPPAAAANGSDTNTPPAAATGSATNTPPAAAAIGSATTSTDIVASSAPAASIASTPATSSAAVVPVASSASASCLHTCEHCGSFLGGNPLVVQGLVPPHLAEILLPPRAKPAQEKKRKIVTEARVISGDEMLRILKEKTESEAQQQADKEKRKAERLEKKARKEKEEEEKKKKKQERKEAIETAKREKTHVESKKKKKNVEVDPQPDALCQVCMTQGEPGWFWAGCDRCDRWFHYRCLPPTDQITVDASLLPGSALEWKCNVCEQEE